MFTISVVSQKGGAGKTTIVIHLAVSFLKKKKKVAIIDLDPQASSARWSDRRKEETPVVISAHASRLENEIKRVEEAGCEYLIIDTAPHSDSSALEAIKASDLVLVPCRHAILDIEAVTSTLSLINLTKVPHFVILNAVSATGNDGNEAEQAIVKLGAKVAPVRLNNRITFSRSLLEGKTAQEVNQKSKAANEVSSLSLFVCAQYKKRTN